MYLWTRLTAEGGDKLNLDVRVEPDNKKGNGSNNPQPQSYEREWTTNVEDALISIDGQLKDNSDEIQFSDKGSEQKAEQQKMETKGYSQGCKGCYDYYIDWNRLQE
mgnify:CR=1 FL=1